MPELLSRLQVALADRYRIEGEIGAGGMATVYLAQDLRHDRKVALKLLRPELSAVIGAERFLAEIKLTANLQHPHILPLFDSGEADGFLFYVMPFVEGESLRSRLNREKQLPVAEAVRIATEVASALDYAHRHGVVHRDIKPENILLHDGRALVADFGIALAASKAGGARMTETGMSLGTPHYMSPEQAMGEREITARSDVYALGVVLYEMLTGDPPFTGSTAQAIVARVLTETPRPILPQRHTMPPQVEAAVLTALEKLPADRFAHRGGVRRGAGGPGHRADHAHRRRRRGTRGARGEAPMGRGQGRIGGRGADHGRHRGLGMASARAEPLDQPVQPLPAAGRGAHAGEAVGQPGGDLAGREADGVRGSGAGREPALAPGARSARLVPHLGDRGRGTPFFSPDSRQIGFLKNGKTLRTVSLAGGPVLTLTDSANSTGGDWGQDGYIYFEVDSGIARIRSSGGPIEPVYNSASRRSARSGAEWPVVLPGAAGILFRIRPPTSRPATSRSWP